MESRRKTTILAAVTLLLAGVCVWLLLRPPPASLLSGPWRLRQLDGTEVDLRPGEGRVLVVNFWATWCEPCLNEIPDLNALAARHDEGDDLEVAGVSVDDAGRVAAVRSFVGEREVRFPVFLDPGWNLAGRFGTAKVPETYIFARDGALAGKFVGELSLHRPRVEALIEKLLQR